MSIATNGGGYGASYGNGYGGPQAGMSDVQLPEDPATQAPVDLSSALRPMASAPARVAPPARAVAPSPAAVRLYGLTLELPRAGSRDLRGIEHTMLRGLDALAEPPQLPAPLPRPPVESADPVASGLAPSLQYSGDDARAAYGMSDDDLRAALPNSAALESGDWLAAYGMDEDADGAAEAFDWRALEEEHEPEGEQAEAQSVDEQLEARLEHALQQAIERTRLMEPRSALDGAFDTEPEPEDVVPFEEQDEESADEAGSARAPAALSFEDVDRMFEEDFAESEK